MKMRKCCNTPKGSGPHEPGCRNDSLKTRLAAMDKDDRIDLLDEIAGDMPDGAYFAMAEEMGIETEDFLDED